MNGIIVLNKDKGFTSMDCCAILRGILHEKKVGHTGTLDPNATGVLPICFGKATRLIKYFEPLNKKYIAGFRLGYTSDTEDVWGNVVKQSDRTYLRDDVVNLLPHGDIDQIPPMYSAKSINGKRLYDLARSGQVVERKACRVHIDKCELLEFDGKEGLLEVECSRGTYIRTICADLGKDLGCGALMTSLNRTASSGFNLEDSVNMDLVMKIKSESLEPSLLEPFIISIDRAMANFYRIDVDKNCFSLLINGNPKAINLLSSNYNLEGITSLYYDNSLIAVVKDGVIDKVFNEDF